MIGQRTPTTPPKISRRMLLILHGTTLIITLYDFTEDSEGRAGG